MANSSQELEQLRGFVLSIIDHTGLDASEADLAPIREAKNVNGMRQAARDMIEMCQDLPADEVAELDKRLEDSGLPTLTAMRDVRYRDLLQVLS
ncbi:MAG: hypothetical protein ACR2QV_12915, partial [Gammaproteobacteria bacterium]